MLSDGRFNGVPVVLLPDGHWRDRLWWERLFSWPWHPMQSQAFVPSPHPENTAYVANGKLFVRRAAYEKLRQLPRDSDHA